MEVDLHRSTIGDDVMQRPPQDMLLRIKRDDSGSQKRSCGEIERTTDLGAQLTLQCDFLLQSRQSL
jgi:hypothetical protein